MGVEAIDPHASKKLDPKLRSHPLSGRNKSNNNNKNQPGDSAPSGGLSAEDARLIKWVKDQHSRRGGFVRIFPREETWSAYGALLEFKTHTNELLAARLFPDTYRSGSAIIRSRAMEDKMATSGGKGRFNQYERRLLAFDSSERKKERRRIRRTRKLKKKKQVEVTSDLDDDPEEAEEEDISPVVQKTEEKSSSEIKVKKSSSEIILRENKTPPTYIENSTIYQSIRSSKMTRTGGQSGSSGPNEIGQGDNRQKDNSKTINSGSMLNTATKQPEPEPKLDITADETNQTRVNEPLPVSDTKTGSGSEVEPAVEPEIEVIPNFKLKEIVTSIKRRARDLCQIEAREAFATYLLRVQQRFMIEATGSTKSTTDLGRKYASEKSRDDQIELVCRFLTRASGNLENPLDLNLPDPETTPITERKKIIGNLLIEFTQRYNKETQALINSGQKISSGIGIVS